MEGLPKKENKSERVFAKAEIVNFVESTIGIENLKVTQELSDEKGLYVLDLEVEGENPGDVTSYEYIRKGVYETGHSEVETKINIVYYEDGIPVGGKNFAQHDEEKGEWVIFNK